MTLHLVIEYKWLHALGAHKIFFCPLCHCCYIPRAWIRIRVYVWRWVSACKYIYTYMYVLVLTYISVHMGIIFLLHIMYYLWMIYICLMQLLFNFGNKLIFIVIVIVIVIYLSQYDTYFIWFGLAAHILQLYHFWHRREHKNMRQFCTKSFRKKGLELLKQIIWSWSKQALNHVWISKRKNVFHVSWNNAVYDMVLLLQFLVPHLPSVEPNFNIKTVFPVMGRHLYIESPILQYKRNVCTGFAYHFGSYGCDDIISYIFHRADTVLA